MMLLKHSSKTHHFSFEEVKRLRKGIKVAIHYLTYPAKYDREVQEQTDKLKELIG